MKHLKNKCIGCERTALELSRLEIKFNKEHITPKWLVLRTGTHKTKVSWAGKKVPGLSATIPLCEECNSLFGKTIETQVIEIFNALENNIGITDYQAEILIRWMWKFEGMQWHIKHSAGTYSDKYTLRERVLQNIDGIRPFLTLSVSIIEKIDPKYGDKPMGIDSVTEFSGLFVSGVFSNLAIMTSYKKFDSYIPSNFSKYHLTNKLNKKKKVKVFFPQTGFIDDTDAVGVTSHASFKLEELHDKFSQNYNTKGN